MHMALCGPANRCSVTGDTSKSFTFTRDVLVKIACLRGRKTRLRQDVGEHFHWCIVPYPQVAQDAGRTSHLITYGSPYQEAGLVRVNFAPAIESPSVRPADLIKHFSRLPGYARGL